MIETLWFLSSYVGGYLAGYFLGRAHAKRQHETERWLQFRREEQEKWLREHSR